MASDFWSFAMMTRRPVPQIGHSGRYGCGTFRSTAAPRKLGVLPLRKVEGNYFAGIGSFTIHPDGKQLAFHSHEGYLEQTWAIDNLVPFIKASAAP